MDDEKLNPPEGFKPKPIGTFNVEEKDKRLEDLVDIAKLNQVDPDETARNYGEMKALSEAKAYQRTLAWIYLRHQERVYEKK